MRRGARGEGGGGMRRKLFALVAVGGSLLFTLLAAGTARTIIAVMHAFEAAKPRNAAEAEHFARVVATNQKALWMNLAAVAAGVSATIWAVMRVIRPPRSDRRHQRTRLGLCP